VKISGSAEHSGALPDLAAADDNFAGVLGLADNLLASRTASVRALARALYAALFRLHDDAAQRERLLRDLVWRAVAWPGPLSGATAYSHNPSSCCTERLQQTQSSDCNEVHAEGAHVPQTSICVVKTVVQVLYVDWNPTCV
jgi:hypothetical protein